MLACIFIQYTHVLRGGDAYKYICSIYSATPWSFLLPKHTLTIIDSFFSGNWNVTNCQLTRRMLIEFWVFFLCFYERTNSTGLTILLESRTKYRKYFIWTLCCTHHEARGLPPALGVPQRGYQFIYLFVFDRTNFFCVILLCIVYNLF